MVVLNSLTKPSSCSNRSSWKMWAQGHVPPLCTAFLPFGSITMQPCARCPDHHHCTGTDKLMISERWPYLKKCIHHEKAISVLSSMKELSYIISSMFPLNKMKQVLTGFQSYQCWLTFSMTKERPLPGEEKRQEKKLSTPNTLHQ